MATKQAKVQEQAKRRPDFIVRAKQSPDSDFWVTLGGAWSFTNKEGDVCYSVKLNTVPTNFDGNMVLMPPLPEKE